MKQLKFKKTFMTLGKKRTKVLVPVSKLSFEELNEILRELGKSFRKNKS